MTTYTNYQTINSLEEFSMIAGNNFVLNFTVYQDDGTTLLDISGATIKWVLCPFGRPEYTVLQKSATITGTGTFKIELLSADTSSLYGKYVHQPVITVGSAVYRPAQGTILIQQQIPVT